MPSGVMKAKVILAAEDRASSTVKKVEGSLSRLTNFVKNRMVITLDSAFRAIGAGFERIGESARLEGQTAALRRQLADQGLAFDEFIGKLQQVSKSQIATADLVKSSSRALLLGIPAEEIAGLLEIAQGAAIALGTDVATAFEDIATGIGRASPMIIDNLGIVLTLGPAYQALADAQGKTVEQLTVEERKRAILNDVQRAGALIIEKTAGAQTDLAIALNQGKAAMGDFGDAAGKVGGILSIGFTGSLSYVAGAMLTFGRVVGEVVSSVLELASSLPFVGDGLRDLSDRARSVSARMGKLARDAFDMGESLHVSARAALSASLGLSAAADSAAALEQSAATATATTSKLAATATVAATSTSKLAVNTAAAAAALSALAADQAETTSEVDAATESLTRHTSATERNVALLERQASALQVVARAARDQAAVDRALAAGFAPSGGRIRLPGGGSRLVREPQTTTNWSGLNTGAFQTTTARRAMILPDGRLAFP